MICPLCKEEFKQITKQHLEYAHGMSIQEFKNVYPAINLGNRKSNEFQEVQLKNRIEKYNENPYHCMYCDKPLSYEQKLHLTTSKIPNTFCSKSCAAKQHNIGRKHTQETKEKIKKGMRKFINGQPLKEKPPKKIKNPKSFIFYKHCKICGLLFISRFNTVVHCSKSCVNKTLSKSAVKSGLGGNHNRKSCWYYSPSAGKIHLESSWEVSLAKEFDINNIQWCRPSYLPWIDEKGIEHKYHPDFFSFTHNIYIEPKNDYLLQKDKKKLEYVTDRWNVSILVISDPLLLTVETINNFSRSQGLTIV